MKPYKNYMIDTMLDSALQNVSSDVLNEIYMYSLGIFQDPQQLHLNCGLCPQNYICYVSSDFPFPIDVKEFGFLSSPIFSCFRECPSVPSDNEEQLISISPISIITNLESKNFEFKQTNVLEEQELDKMPDFSDLLCSTCHKRIPVGRKIDNTPYKTCSMCIARKKKHYRKIKYMSKFDF